MKLIINLLTVAESLGRIILTVLVLINIGASIDHILNDPLYFGSPLMFMFICLIFWCCLPLVKREA